MAIARSLAGWYRLDPPSHPHLFLPHLIIIITIIIVSIDSISYPRTTLYKHSLSPFLSFPPHQISTTKLKPLSSPPFHTHPVLHIVPYIAPSIPSPRSREPRVPISYSLITSHPLLSLPPSLSNSSPQAHHSTTPP